MTINTETKRIFPVDSADPFTDDDIERYRVAGPKILDALAEHIRVLCLTASDTDTCLNTETVASEVISTLLHKFHFDDVRVIALDPYASLMPVVELIQTAANVRGYPAFAKGDNVVTDAICDHWYHIGELMVQRAKSLYATVEGTENRPDEEVHGVGASSERMPPHMAALECMRTDASLPAITTVYARELGIPAAYPMSVAQMAALEDIERVFSEGFTCRENSVDLVILRDELIRSLQLHLDDLIGTRSRGRRSSRRDDERSEARWQASARSRDERYDRRDRSRMPPSEEALEIVRDILMDCADKIGEKLPRRR